MGKRSRQTCTGLSESDRIEQAEKRKTVLEAEEHRKYVEAVKALLATPFIPHVSPNKLAVHRWEP